MSLQLNWLARYLPLLPLLDAHARHSTLEVGPGTVGVGPWLKSPFVGAEVRFDGAPHAPMLPVRYGGGRLPFADRAFDTVVCMDTLEHVPPASREVFVSELLRVSAARVVLAFPADEEGLTLDVELRRVFAAWGQGSPPWLQEHLSLGLPRSDEVEAWLTAAEGFRHRPLPSMGSLPAMLFTLADLAPALGDWLRTAVARSGDAFLQWANAATFGPHFRKSYLLERTEASRPRFESNQVESLLKALECPRCGQVALQGAGDALRCAACEARHPITATGVVELQRAAPKASAVEPRAPATTFYAEPDWLGDPQWAGWVHNFLHAFPPDAPVRLWLQVDGSRCSEAQAAALLEPLHAQFGAHPFPELAVSASAQEAPPERERVSLPVSSAERPWPKARFLEKAGVDPRDARAAPPETPERRAERVLRNKRLLDQVALNQARLHLERRRAERPDIWTGEPLISIRVCTYDRPQLLVERAIASVRQQTYPNWEMVIVGDGAGEETAEAVARVGDPRVHYENLPARPRYPQFPRWYWSTAGSYAANRALDLCRGEWVAPLDDDDEFTPDHLERLLAEAQRRQLEMVYGQMEVHDHGRWVAHGREGLVKANFCHGSVLYSARLGMLRYDPFCWLDDEPADWNLWKRMGLLGARWGFLPRLVGRHHPEYTSVAPEERARLFQRVASVNDLLGDVERAGANHLLELE